MHIRTIWQGFYVALFAIFGFSGALFAQDMDNETTESDDPYENWDVSNPPGEFREITLNVDEGTWMNVDVSPDGETVIFDLLGDIYAVSINGGEATALTSGFAWDMQPRFSPDGSRIVFTSDRNGGDNIWIMNADGSEPEELTSENFRLLNNPAWSPDGNYIAARKHFTTQRSAGTGEIWIYDVRTGNGLPVIERPNPTHQKDLGEPVYSPDGQYIYYSLDQTLGGSFEYAQDSNGEIYNIRRVDLVTGEIETIVEGAGGAVRPTISPDGQSIAYLKRIRAQSQLFVMDIASGISRVLYEDMDQDNQETWAVQGTYPNMAFTPDGESVVFWAGGKIRRVNIDTGEASVIPFRVNDTRQIMDPPRPMVDVAPDSFETKMIRWAQVSPDGDQLVFGAMGHLYTMALPNGRPERLTEDGNDHFEYYPSFSRDGRWITFVSWDDEALGAVRKVRNRGGRSRILTETPGLYTTPHFSPDGQTIVYQKLEGGYLTSPLWSRDTGIFTVPADGGPSHKVTDDGYYAHFGAENDRVYLMRFNDTERVLISVNLDGLDERELATSTWAEEIRVSPDSKWVAVRENYQVYVSPLVHTGKAYTIGRDASSVPTKRVSDPSGNFISWSADSQSLHWSVGPNFMSADVEDAIYNEEWELEPNGIDMSMQVESQKPDGMVALTGARIITMADDETIIENGTILVEDNRIIAIGGAGSVEIPDGVPVADMTGKTIMPGLIDAHAHGSSAEYGIIPEQNWDAMGHVAFGVTTIHDPSHTSADIFTAAEMQRAGLILAPRTFSTGRIIYGAQTGVWAPIESYEDALDHVQRLKAEGAISVKNYNQPRRNQRQQVVAAARAENMLVVPEGGAVYGMDMNLIADGNSSVEHTLPNQAIYNDVVQFWSQTEVAFNQTMVVNYGGLRGEDYFYEHTEVWKHPILSNYIPPYILQPRAVRRQAAPDEDYAFKGNADIAWELQQNGVLIMTGAHGQREGLATHWELWLLAASGAPEMEILKMATSNPAKHLGMWQDIGSLEVGKLADLVVMDANPLDDIYNTDDVSHVMLNGRLYESGTLNEVVTGNTVRPPLFWKSLPGADAR